jgi:hypothetical protein
MPNQHGRKKKAGANKIKKLQAMRAKESMARPPDRPSATGKGIGERSKFETFYERPGALKRG